MDTMSNELYMNRNNNIYSVPEGYFAQLQDRLCDIPVQSRKMSSHAEPVSMWDKVRPYLALAACFVMAFRLGNFILGDVSGQPQDELSLQDIRVAGLIPVTDPYSIYDDVPDFSEEDETVSDTDVVEYLISSGASVDYIAYLLNE